jgi:hypothetical protein
VQGELQEFFLEFSVIRQQNVKALLNSKGREERGFGVDCGIEVLAGKLNEQPLAENQSSDPVTHVSRRFG